MLDVFFFFFFKQKTAYEMRISDWSQTCALPISVRRFGLVTGLSWSGGLGATGVEWWRRDVTAGGGWVEVRAPVGFAVRPGRVVEWRVRAESGSGSWRGGVCEAVWSSVVSVTLKKKKQ